MIKYFSHSILYQIKIGRLYLTIDAKVNDSIKEFINHHPRQKRIHSKIVVNDHTEKQTNS